MDARKLFVDRLTQYFGKQRIFKDRFLRWFIFIAILLLVTELSLLAIRLRPTDFVVPLTYSTGAGLSGLGEWQRIYSYGAFSLFVTVGNIALAMLALEKSRITSFFLLSGLIVINAFTVVVTYNLLNQLA